MKVYGDPGSGSTRRVLATLAHLGLEAEEVLIDLFKGDQLTPVFLALNPNATIPALVDGDVTLYEASAIMIYLAEKQGDTSLWPTGAARYETLKWMFWAAEHFRKGPPLLFGERFVKKVQGLPEDPRIIAEADAMIRKYSAVLDAHLKDRRFIVGDHVTLADFDVAAPFTQYSRIHPPFVEFPNVMAWHQRLLDEVPAWKSTRYRVEARIGELSAALGVTF
ncbi:MAG: Glutathione S-transferase domain [Pseudomonas sp.]|nr:Glutathione S-transferase domain [Pseudomonas sp.]